MPPTPGQREDRLAANFLEAEPEVGMSFAHAAGGGPTETEVCAPMKVLIGVDPHKTSLAVAAVDEAAGELVEGAVNAKFAGYFWQERVALPPD